ncbi:MAG: Mur ligase family protein [Patescibacteria group bacterium]
MTLLISLIIYLWTSLPLLKIIQIKDYFSPSIWAHFDLPSSWKIFFEKREIVIGLIWFALLAIAITGANFPIHSIWGLLSLILVIALFSKRKEFLKSFKWTPKFLFINALLLILIFRILQYSNTNLLIVVFLLAKIGQFPIVLISTFIANFLTKIFIKPLHKKATAKIIEFKKNGGKVIGITGSYGKSTTKELLAQLLSVRYKVLKSPLRLNAEIGLTQFVIDADLKNIDYLILEMGARIVGDIETVVNIFEPDIVYLTGLAPQHIATFGSMEKIIKTKLEIFAREQQTRIAILNGDDELVKDIFSGLNITNKYLYGRDGHFYSKNENYSLNGTKFTFVYPEGETEFETNLITPQQIDNLIGVMAGCYLNGIKPDELTDKIKELKLLQHSYTISKKENPLIIDDSYNANIVGVQKGAEYFVNLELQTKIIIFAGILELGAETQSYYKNIIETFKKTDKVFLTFKDFSDIFTENLNNTEIIDEEKFKNFYNELQKENCGILILGRVPNWIFEIIK